MHRAIVGFHQDDRQDWVADLACAHTQHVRHCPPMSVRPWVLTTDGRAQRIGTSLDCRICDGENPPPGRSTSATR